jgi:hypothetical protein
MNNFNSLQDLNELYRENGLENVVTKLDEAKVIKIPTTRFGVVDGLIYKEKDIKKEDFSVWFTNNYSRDTFRNLYNEFDGSGYVTPCYYNGQKFIHGVDFISFYALDFDLDYEYNIILIPYDYVIDFLSDLKDKKLKLGLIHKWSDECASKRYNLMKDRDDFRFKNKIIPFENKKDKAKLLKHFCYFYKNQKIETQILNWFGIHQNSVLPMSKRMHKLEFDKKQIDDCIDFIFNR